MLAIDAGFIDARLQNFNILQFQYPVANYHPDFDHPDFDTEQAYIDRAYEWLEIAREKAFVTADALRGNQGDTRQARYELDTMLEGALERLKRLEIGDRSLVFGSIDLEDTKKYFHIGRMYIGRVGIWDDDNNSITVDWRAPIAELFYRATGVQTLGLKRRCRFISRGKILLGIEDEIFGEQPFIGLNTGPDTDFNTNLARQTLSNLNEIHGTPNDNTTGGHTALPSALEAPRTGRLSDIVSTIQKEQDMVIRADLPGVVAVQGGPGTGKTVVALHRASYLLYTHRFPLEGQGIIIIGPNRLFLAYIEQVLPSLGEAGVRLAVLEDLLTSKARVSLLDSDDTSRIKGDRRMGRMLSRAIRDRQRPLRQELQVGYGLQKLRMSVEQSKRIIEDTQRLNLKHNDGRQRVEKAFFEMLAGNAKYDASTTRVRKFTAHRMEVREALEWMWPNLTAEQLLNDLFGSKALLRSAGADVFSSAEIDLLYRPRGDHAAAVRWSRADVALLDEAQNQLGCKPDLPQTEKDKHEVVTYGHIVIDEVQDFSPMQLRMIARRSLNGSMTVVGDIAQAIGAWYYEDWNAILQELPQRRQHVPHRQFELTTGYRIPASLMSVANRVLKHAAPDLKAPTPLRKGDDEPSIVAVSPSNNWAFPTNQQLSSDESDIVVVSPDLDTANEHAEKPVDVVSRTAAIEHKPSVLSELIDELVDVVAAERSAVGQGNVAVIVPASLFADIRDEFVERGVDFAGSTNLHSLRRQVLLLPVRLVKGLEVDAAIVVEPQLIVAEETHGARSLYVSVTRATKKLTILHARALPKEML